MPFFFFPEAEKKILKIIWNLTDAKYLSIFFKVSNFLTSEHNINLQSSKLMAQRQIQGHQNNIHSPEPKLYRIGLYDPEGTMATQGKHSLSKKCVEKIRYRCAK